MKKLNFFILTLFLLSGFIFAENTAVRNLPDTYISGSTFNVTISITISQQTPVTGIVITESLPSGWSVVSANPYWSKYIASSNSYKWLYFFQSPVYGSFNISYTVRVPSDASGSYNFTGTINDQYSVRNIIGDTTINQHQQVSAPVFSLQSQTFYNFFPDLEINCSTLGAIIYYTTDGSDPDQTSLVYSSPIHITQTTTIKSRAYKESFSPSQITQATYEIQIQKADINRDGVVDISDVILCLRMAISLDITIESQQYNAPYNDWLITVANVNNDNTVDISDVILALRISIGLP